MEISVIASGSNGNCCLVENKNSSFLIDAGKSCKEIEHRLDKLGKYLENISGILITHAHGDHIASAGIISRKYNKPVYITKQVFNQCETKIGKADIKFFNLNSSFKVDGLNVKPIITSHDVPSCGFVVKNFGLFTDTGIVTPEMNSAIKKLKGVLLESNYDKNMLINGPYPYFLKKRINSDNGHLSNECASSFIQEKSKDLSWVLLGHLSANNNTPELTKSTFESVVKKNIDFSVLSRNRESGIWHL